MTRADGQALSFNSSCPEPLKGLGDTHSAAFYEGGACGRCGATCLDLAPELPLLQHGLAVETTTTFRCSCGRAFLDEASFRVHAEAIADPAPPGGSTA